MHWNERQQNREEGRELARVLKDCKFKQGESRSGPPRGGPSCKGPQRVKVLVTGASGEACSGRWRGHCKGPETGAPGMFRNLEGGERNGGLRWSNGARPLRVLGRKRKIKTGLGPAEHVGARFV